MPILTYVDLSQSYPDYETAWSDAGCLNTMPIPFNRGDRPEYDTHLACCKAAYG